MKRMKADSTFSFMIWVLDSDYECDLIKLKGLVLVLELHPFQYLL